MCESRGRPGVGWSGLELTDASSSDAHDKVAAYAWIYCPKYCDTISLNDSSALVMGM